MTRSAHNSRIPVGPARCVRRGMAGRGMSLTIVLVLVFGFAGGAAPASAADPGIGAAGLGDRLNPGIGNGGYDVLDYDLRLRYATADPAQALEGDETITARATQALSRFKKGDKTKIVYQRGSESLSSEVEF